MAESQTTSWWRSGQGMAAMVGLVGVLIASLIGLRPWESASARVEVVNVTLADGSDDQERNAIEPATIDISMRNVGGEISVIHRVDLRVLDVGVLEVCEGGVGLAPSVTYDAVLSASTQPGSTIEVPISQALEPNSADRIVIRVFPSDSGESYGYEIVMAQLELNLFQDRSESPLPGGRVVIATPWAPAEYWFADELVSDVQSQLDAGETVDPDMLSVYECYRDNRVAFDRLTALDGERVPALSATADRDA